MVTRDWGDEIGPGTAQKERVYFTVSRKIERPHWASSILYKMMFG